MTTGEFIILMYAIIIIPTAIVGIIDTYRQSRKTRAWERRFREILDRMDKE